VVISGRLVKNDRGKEGKRDGGIEGWRDRKRGR